ncbi:MAG: hypothetical protein EOP10_07890 [Proteobacteria bacterium]|nr:MAG: hypothetical protein EOP10_07890 [Pseudomonadota bacterium]
MQRFRKRREKDLAPRENTAWTTNSDLFMAIAVIFLVMFVYALLSSGASQISTQQEKIEAQKYLLGQIPESDKTKTAAEMEEAAKDLQEMAQKRKILEISLSEMAKIATAMDKREATIKNLFERQNQNQGLIERSQAIIAEKEKELNERGSEVASIQFKAKSLTSDLVQTQKQMKNLESELQKSKKDSQEQAAELVEAQSLIAEKNKQVEEAQASTRALQKSLDSQGANSDSAQKSIAGRLASEQKKSKQLEESLGALKAKADSSAEKVSEQNKAMGAQEEQLSTIQGQLTNKVKELTTANDKGEQLARAIAKLQGDLAEAKAQNNALTKANGGLSDQNSKLTAANSKLGEALKKGQGENENLKASMQSLGDKLSGLEGKAKGLADENGKLKGANGSLGDALKKGEGEIEGLNSKLRGMGDKLAGLEGQLKGLGKENEGLKGSLAAKNGDLDKLKKDTGLNDKLAKELDVADKENAALEKKMKNAVQKLADIQDKLKDEGNKNKDLVKELDKANAANVQLAKEKDKTEKTLADVLNGKDALAKNVAALVKDKAQIEQQKNDLGQELKDLMGSNNDLGQKLTQTEKVQVVCEEEKNTAREKQNELAKNVKDNEKKLGEVAKTLQDARKAVQDIDNERKHIASNIANNLKQSGVEVEVNPETGNITLRMDESFYFKNASYELREEAKEKLSKLIPVYAQSLLGTSKIANRIEKILVTGYASPSFNKTFVDPSTAVGEPYEYNLDLSVNRAKEIVAFMFGSQISSYEFKDRMRAMVSVSGMGLMGAIPLEKTSMCGKETGSLSKAEDCSCGPFDCKKSRRVEIQFVLKNQKDTERQLQKISDKLNEQGVKNVSH